MSVSHVDMQLALRTKALSLTTTLSTAFSRASTATYTDVNGIVQTAAIDVPRNAHYASGVLQVPLVEAAGSNTLTWSEDFTNAVWTKNALTVTPNATASPSGVANAGKLVTTASTATHFLSLTSQLTQGINVGDAYSLHVKAGEYNWLRITLFAATGGIRNTWFNAATGLFGTVSPNVTSASVVGLASGWYRIKFIFNTGAGSATTSNINIGIAQSDADTAAFLGDGTSGLYLWGTQREPSTAAVTSYVTSGATAGVRAADVGSVFAATATGYTRDSGSFIADGYSPGTQVRPVGFSSNTPDTLIDVSALSMTTRSTHSVEAGLLGRNFTVGLPSDFAWENLRFTPTQGVPYVKEEYLPGPMSLDSMGTSGNITVEPTYRLTVYVPQNSGISADGAYADALLNLFAPSTEMLLPDGNVLFVRADVSPIRGQRVQQQGLTGIPVTIPLRAYINNADTTNPFYVVFTDSDGDIAISSSITAALAQYQLVTISSDGDVLAP